MRQNKILAAIDIGTTKIVTIVGRLNGSDKLEILGMSKAPSRGVKRGVVLNIEEAVGAIRQTVDEVQDTHIAPTVSRSEISVGKLCP